MNAPDKFLTLNLGEAEVRVPREAAVIAYLQQLVEEQRTVRLEEGRGLRYAFHEDCAPAVGSEYQGGIYAGMSIHEGKPVDLILLPGDKDDGTWNDAVKWAEEQGGMLPSRIDQLVLRANLKAEFKPECYWSGEQLADDERYAWYQDFSLGNQYYLYKSTKLRARAVRRVTI